MGLPGACTGEKGLTFDVVYQHTLGSSKCGELSGFRELGFVGRNFGSGGDFLWHGAW